MYSMAVRTCPVNPRQHKFAVIADSAIWEVNINCSHYTACRWWRIHLRTRWSYCIGTVSVGKAGQTDKTVSALLGCSCSVSWAKVLVSQCLKILSSLDPLRHWVLPVQYMYVKDGGHLVVVAQWQSTGGSSQRCPGFDSWRLPAFSLSSIFASWFCKLQYNGGVKTRYIPCRRYMLSRYVSIWCLQASNTPSVLTSTQYVTTPYHEYKSPRRARAMRICIVWHITQCVN